MFGKINWKVRFMNKTWVATFIAAIFVLIYAVGDLFGFHLDLSNVQDNIIKVVYAIFGILAVIGVSIDGTTEGIYDSERAQGYTMPGMNVDEFDEDVADDSDGIIDEEELSDIT